jgi:hypothetical protein
MSAFMKWYDQQYNPIWDQALRESRGNYMPLVKNKRTMKEMQRTTTPEGKSRHPTPGTKAARTAKKFDAEIKRKGIKKKGGLYA